jgi:hypothetical protein
MPGECKVSTLLFPSLVSSSCFIFLFHPGPRHWTAAISRRSQRGKAAHPRAVHGVLSLRIDVDVCTVLLFVLLMYARVLSLADTQSTR